MDVRQLDQELERLRADADRAGANLFALDQLPARALLAAASLEGESARRWAEAEQALADLFQSYAELCGVLDAAVAARGSGSISGARRAEVAHLVFGPSVELPERAVPLAERDLVGRSRTLQRCTPSELLAVMAEQFAVARATVVAAGEAWEVGVPGVSDLRAWLAALVTSGGVGTSTPEVVALDRRLREVADRLVSDPLTVSRADIDALGEQLDDLVSARDAARRARVDLDDDVAAAAAELASLREAVAAAQSAQTEAEARIAGLAPLPSVPLDTLATDLDHVGALADRGDERAVAAALAAWHRQAEQHRRQLDDAAAAQRGALEQRRRLRGRLDAYTAKAAHLRCLEQPHLEQLLAEAEAVLFGAPIDLGLAEEAVLRYQRELDAAAAERAGPSR
jgi:hypothetical protein